MDTSALFKTVDPNKYEATLKKLQELREAHPYYRDEQLLMYWICTDLLKEK